MDVPHFRDQAERCRLLVAIALKAEVKQQLRLWASELDDLADIIEVREHGHGYVEEGALSGSRC